MNGHSGHLLLSCTIKKICPFSVTKQPYHHTFMFPGPQLRLRDPGCQSCVAENQQCYSYSPESECERCSNRCSLLPGKPSPYLDILYTNYFFPLSMLARPQRHRGIMYAIRLMRPRCDYCRDMKKICKGRTGEACTECAQLCSNCMS
jgi:hypothetical protein